ncbi:MAG: hypothetical protein WBI14_08145 [Anaerolineaceae bacterium]
MKARRLVFFFVAILIGLGAGLAFGWLMAPPKAPENADLKQLRADYKADVVLMTAESFASNPDPLMVLNRLDDLDSDPLTLMVNAMSYAEKVGYSSADLTLMRTMFTAIDQDAVTRWQRGTHGN